MRTIESPGVEIKETDLSQIGNLPIGTNVLVMGFANQGPTYELINVTDPTEDLRIFGNPTNAAERYFYHTKRQILNAGGNLMAIRLPYGEGMGLGSDYSALLYPVFGVPGPSATNTNLLAECSSYYIGQPYHVDLTESQYNQWLGGTIGDNPSIWNMGSVTIADAATGINSVGDAYKAGIIVLNSAKTSINQYYEGYYVSITDNSRMDGVIYDYIQAVQSVGVSTPSASWIPLTDATLLFDLTGTQNSRGSISETIEFIPNFNFGDASYNDEVILSVFKLSRDPYGNDNKLKFILIESFIGSVDSFRNEVSFAGTTQSAYLENKVNGISNYVNVLINPAISKISGSWADKNKKIRVYSRPYTFSSSISSEGTPAVGSYDAIMMVPYNKESANVISQDSQPAGGTQALFMDLRAGSYDLVVNFDGYSLNPTCTAWGWDFGDGYTAYPPNSAYETLSHTYTGYTETNLSITVTITGEVDGSAETLVVSSFGLTILPYVTSYGPFTYGDALYSNGLYASNDITTQKRIGCYTSNGLAGPTDQSLITKIETALALAENKEQIPLDIVCEAGLGTIWAAVRNTDVCSVSTSLYFDTYDDTIGINETHITELENPTLGSSSVLQNDYETVLNTLRQFVQDTRADCIAIADGLRHIYVQGADSLRLNDRSKNFSSNIYMPLKNLFGSINSNYVAAYANWVKAYDSSNDIYVWLPISGYIANIMCKLDSNLYPWWAPAGLNNGIIRDIVDIAINPNQKQRDLLYRNGLNPVVYFPGDGYTVWGQKTLQSKKSAFDRINVRRLFLTLEKAVLPILRYFVMEPNTVFTRTRVVNTLTPLFDVAKNNSGVYDYLIVCDDRNNTPLVIDNNELVVDIYLKPVRTAEFIRVNFVATRTDQSFQELIGG